MRVVRPSMIALTACLAVSGCGKGPAGPTAQTKPVDPTPPAATTRSADPAKPATPTGLPADSPAATNSNNLVIGGDNRDPQMGLFALSREDAAEVRRTLGTDSKTAYDLALAKAKKAWAGKRNFCADSVRMTIGYLGTDGMLDAADWAKWKTASFERLKDEHLAKIVAMHKEMIDEDDPAGCERALATYTEALRYAANQELELLNFGF